MEALVVVMTWVEEVAGSLQPSKQLILPFVLWDAERMRHAPMKITVFTLGMM